MIENSKSRGTFCIGTLNRGLLIFIFYILLFIMHDSKTLFCLIYFWWLIKMRSFNSKVHLYRWTTTQFYCAVPFSFLICNMINLVLFLFKCDSWSTHSKGLHWTKYTNLNLHNARTNVLCSMYKHEPKNSKQICFVTSATSKEKRNQQKYFDLHFVWKIEKLLAVNSMLTGIPIKSEADKCKNTDIENGFIFIESGAFHIWLYQSICILHSRDVFNVF